MDDDLSQRARQLIDVAMDEDVPPPAIADGSWEMVISRLTIEAARDVAASPQPDAPRRGWVGIAVLALVVVVAGGLLWLLLQPRPKAPPVAPPAPPAAPSRTATPPAALPESPPTPPVAPDPAIAAAKLLDEAENATPTRALELVDRHAELSPTGPDAERRMVLRIATLCRLDRIDDARAEARAFLANPRDPKWTKQVRASCGVRAPTK